MDDIDIGTWAISIVLAGWVGITIDRTIMAAFHEDVRRAEQLVRSLPAEQIVDNPRLLSQAKVPEQVMRLMTSREVREILRRPPMDEVVVLPVGRTDSDP